MNTHKAIVSAELFEKVQNVIKLKQEKALPKKRFIEYADSWKTG